MKETVRKLINSCLSLITTFLIMASPIAAIIYASDSTYKVKSYDVEQSVQGVYAALEQDSAILLDKIDEQKP